MIKVNDKSNWFEQAWSALHEGDESYSVMNELTGCETSDDWDAYNEYMHSHCDDNHDYDDGLEGDGWLIVLAESKQE